jgi:hypothetical protein
MSSARPEPEGFRWTMRRLALVPVVYFGALALVLWASLRSPQGPGTFNATTLLVLLSPWAIGVVIALVKRADPVRNWLLPLLFSLFLPAALLCYDAHLTLMFSRGENAQVSLMALATNAIFLAWYVKFVAKLSPRTCPECGHRSLIPLASLWKDDPRTLTTRWCASCGDKFWPDRQGIWRPEKRRTWLDEPRPSDEPVPRVAASVPPPHDGLRHDHPTDVVGREEVEP